jgi:Flp pilus assembly protein TadG
MWSSLRRLWRNEGGAVAPIVALSLTGLIAGAGIAIDYTHVEALHTEVQGASDQAALAAASQLDGKSGACARAAAAAVYMLKNNALFANGSANRAISVTEESTCDATGKIKFYQSYDQSTDTPGTAATSDANATVVIVQVDAKQAAYALTPIVSLFSSGDITGTAIASIGHAICKTPPVMVCNPDEPASNTNESLGYTPAVGVGLKLITGDATTPGNFGWLQSNNGPGASNLAEELGYNQPPGDCQPAQGVTTKTGLSKSVLDAFNTRFDVFANGNQTCPSQDGGTCSPSDVARKDLVCSTNGGTPTACKGNWSEANNPYRLPQSCTGSGKNQVCTTPVADLKLDASQDPKIMGYPPDECHMGPTSGACGIAGDGKWDRNAYFRVNYGWDASTWQAQTGLTSAATRYQVYQWERAHPNVSGNGIADPQKDSGNNYAFGQPANGVAGVSPATGQADRRVMSVAVLNCQALNLHGHSTAVPVAAWTNVFLVQPVISRSPVFSDSNIYVEMIGVTSVKTDITSQVVLRDKPYLIK